MFVRTTWTHVKFLLGKTSSKITFFALFLVMLLNFVLNVLYFRGYDVIEMYHPMNILSLSYDRTSLNADAALLLIQLLPLLVGWPAGLALAADRGIGADTMLVARLGRKLYVTSKLTAVFIATAIVFSVPFLLEIVLNCLSFPLTATGNLAGIDVFDSDYAEMLGNYLCPWLSPPFSAPSASGFLRGCWPASRPPSPCSSGSASACSCCFRCSFCCMPSLHSNP